MFNLLKFAALLLCTLAISHLSADTWTDEQKQTSISYWSDRITSKGIEYKGISYHKISSKKANKIAATIINAAAAEFTYTDFLESSNQLEGLLLEGEELNNSVLNEKADKIGNALLGELQKKLKLPFTLKASK